MFEKSKSGQVGTKPVPMKLFATWEVDRTPSNCIPRLCSLTLTRLQILRSFGTDLSYIFIAVKIQGSKRTLRSNEIMLPPDGLLDTELQLTFSLQYPHFLKTKGNKLHIMLQRRKKYKNRTILGYKTLAQGVVNMSEVLQKGADLELDLISNGKDTYHTVTAKVFVNSLSSQPVDYEGTGKAGLGHIEDSDDEEEFSSNEDGSDSEQMLEQGLRKPPSAVRQRNLKEKFISLLKRFKAHEEDLQELDSDRDGIGRNLSGNEIGEMDPADFEDLFDELENLCDSDKEELDSLSVNSNPKPSLRPFFSSTRSLSNGTKAAEGEAGGSGDPPIKTTPKSSKH